MMTFDPEYSLEYPVMAEKTGFDNLWLGDHYLPWHDSFEHSFFAWELLAVIAAKTRRMTVGTDVTVPIGARYHPAIIAQAAATMDRLFPGRFALGVGSGEAINEQWFWGSWPKWPERMERLLEGVELIKKLWAEKDYFEFKGKYFQMGKTKLYVKPKKKIPIYVSATGKKSAFQAGLHGHMLMSAGNFAQMRDVVFPSFDAGARSAGLDPGKLEKVVVTAMGTGPEQRVVERVRRLSAGATIDGMVNEGDPREVEREGLKLKKADILKNVFVFQRADQVIELVSEYRKLGATQVASGDASVEPREAMRIYSKVTEYFKQEAGGRR